MTVPLRPSVPFVVADMIPLNYLILIEAAQVLPELFERVLVPGAVVENMSRAVIEIPVTNPPTLFSTPNPLNPNHLPNYHHFTRSPPLPPRATFEPAVAAVVSFGVLPKRIVPLRRAGLSRHRS